MSALWSCCMFLLVSGSLSMLMPVHKADGSVDLSSIASHFSYLDQALQEQRQSTKASHAEMLKVKAELAVTKTKLTAVEVRLQETQADLRKAQADLKNADKERAILKLEVLSGRPANNNSKKYDDEISTMKKEIASLRKDCPCNKTSTLQTEIEKLRQDFVVMQHNASSVQSNTLGGTSGGATYIRWGRSSCPAVSDLVYEGFASGTHYSFEAGAATILCLPRHPIYGEHTANGHGNYLYGTEYQTTQINATQHLQDEDMPCAVCRSPTKTSAIMVPARNQCLPDWSLEYSGYLMGPQGNYASGENVCVDGRPESVVGGQRKDDGQRMYLAESVCGSLPCPPYQQHWELTCCVCSR